MISVSDNRLTDLDSASVSLMTHAVTDRPPTAWGVYNYEQVMPANIYGRYVYTFLMGGGIIYIRELEVFAPFAYGQ